MRAEPCRTISNSAGCRRQDLLALRRYGAQHSAAPAAWAAVRELLRDNAGGAPRTLIGIPCDSPELTPSERRRYDACIDITLPPHGELVRKRLAAGDYAVFQFRGTLAALEQAHGAVRWHWYPQSGTRMRDVPAFHRLGDVGGDGELVAEIFFPVESNAARARGASVGKAGSRRADQQLRDGGADARSVVFPARALSGALDKPTACRGRPRVMIRETMQEV